MNQDTKPSPFNLGDHVRYVADETRCMAGDYGTETKLAHGMTGVVVLSSGCLSDRGYDASKPWHCQVQFQNGHLVEITPDNAADFALTAGHDHANTDLAYAAGH